MPLLLGLNALKLPGKYSFYNPKPKPLNPPFPEGVTYNVLFKFEMEEPNKVLFLTIPRNENKPWP